MKKIFVLVIVIGLLLSAISQYIARGFEQQFPPIGSFVSVNGAAMHYVERGVLANNDKPAVIFIHGAGSNLRDLMHANGDRLTDQLRLLFVDRPGHGYSESFDGSNDVTRQAKAIAGLMDELKIPTAVIVGHSFGGAVASAFGVLYPEKTKGLVLIAQASHPWPTGITWYYDIASIPGIGW